MRLSWTLARDSSSAPILRCVGSRPGPRRTGRGFAPCFVQPLAYPPRASRLFGISSGGSDHRHRCGILQRSLLRRIIPTALMDGASPRPSSRGAQVEGWSLLEGTPALLLAFVLCWHTRLVLRGPAGHLRKRLSWMLALHPPSSLILRCAGRSLEGPAEVLLLALFNLRRARLVIPGPSGTLQDEAIMGADAAFFSAHY